jgi:hypothetical protein
MMLRKLILAGVAALSLAPVARADLPPLTIEMAREAAAANVPLMMQSIDQIIARCPTVHVFGGVGDHKMDAGELASILADAQAQHVIPSTIWLRRNDAALAKCLPSAPLAN